MNYVAFRKFKKNELGVFLLPTPAVVLVNNKDLAPEIKVQSASAFHNHEMQLQLKSTQLQRHSLFVCVQVLAAHC